MSGINILPGVYYNEKVQTAYYGEGGEIPCFIGKTNNSDADGSKITRYNTFEDLSKSTSDGGIGATGNLEEDLKNNPLLAILKGFYEEIEPTSYNSISVPYIYVIDVGDGADLSKWLTALETSKIYRDINLEVYYGIEYLEDELQTFLDKSTTSIIAQAKKLDLRRRFTTIGYKFTDDGWVEVTDADLINLAQANKQYNRLSIVQHDYFGQIIGRYCVTKMGEEAGHEIFNTILPGAFKERTPAQQLSMQTNGVVICRDEYSSSTFYPKILLGVCTSFGKSVGDRPADSLDSNRRIADYVLSQVFDACYPQIKARETRTQLVKLQTAINTIVYNAVEDGLCVEYNEYSNTEGTTLTVAESDDNPYAMIISGQIQPVNCTIAIDVEATITQAAMKATEEA